MIHTIVQKTITLHLCGVGLQYHIDLDNSLATPNNSRENIYLALRNYFTHTSACPNCCKVVYRAIR